MKDKEEFEVAKQHIKEADIVITNYPYGSAKRLGLDYPTLKLINPNLIVGNISAYGPSDPRPGFDALLQAETGWMSMNGQTSGPPTKMPVALIDILAAHQLKEGLLLALIIKLKHGKGSYVGVSLYDTAVATLSNQASNYLNLDIIPGRKGSLHPNIAPYGEIVQSKNGDELLLAVGNQKQFESLCKMLNLPQLKTLEKFKSNTLRVEHREELFDRLQAAFNQFTTAELLNLSKNKQGTSWSNKKSQTVVRRGFCSGTYSRRASR